MRTIAEIVKRQLGPQLEMVRDALDACPDSAFEDGEIGLREHLYHTLIGVDVWFTEDIFAYPFDQIVDQEAGNLRAPANEKVTKSYMLEYANRMIEKMHNLPEGNAAYLDPTVLRGQEFTMLDRCIGQFRHVQHHLGVFNERMRAHGLSTVPWKGFGES